MEKTFKGFRLTKENIEILERVKSKYNFRNDTQVIEFIISNSEGELKKGNAQIRELEKKVDILFEMINSLLIHADCNSHYNIQSIVVKQAEEHLKKEREKLRTKKLTQENII